MLSQQNSLGTKHLTKSKPINIIVKNKTNNSDNINYVDDIHNTNDVDNIHDIDDIHHIDNINSLGSKSNSKKIENTYKLDSICFDPTKFSPPDNWSIRLKNRIRNYDNNKSYTYINYLFDNK